LNARSGLACAAITCGFNALVGLTRYLAYFDKAAVEPWASIAGPVLRALSVMTSSKNDQSCARAQEEIAPLALRMVCEDHLWP
jgi:hypothetical protein